jgi:signal transduction histidine kinase/PAS domain-containing protein
MSTLASLRREVEDLRAENGALKQRVQEFDEALAAIHGGEVDALVVREDLFTLESAQAAGVRLRQHVLDQMDDAVIALDNDGHLIFVNPAAEQRYNVQASGVLGLPSSAMFSESNIRFDRNSDGGVDGAPTCPNGATDRPSARWMSTHTLRSDARVDVESNLSPLMDSRGTQIGQLVVTRDVTQRLKAEERRLALLRLADGIRDADDLDEIGFLAGSVIGTTLGASRAGFAIVDPHAETAVLSRHWTKDGSPALTACVNLRDYGAFIDDLKRGDVVRIVDVAHDTRTAHILQALAAHGIHSMVNVPLLERGKLVAMVYVNQDKAHIWSSEEVAFIAEVADRAQAAAKRAGASVALQTSETNLRLANENLEAMVEARTAELLKAQEELRQSQKMEAVGQLTGGIAHDFNNLLGSMSAALQVLQVRLNAGRVEGSGRYVGIAQESIKRAAALTQRLLAFARRQTLDPKPTDVNRLIGGLEDLISRTVGPHVKLEVVGSAGLWTAKLDPSQLENSVLNLCINARDAMMPSGGKLTIETANKWIDNKLAAERDLPPGQYISLCVTDTGCGMPPEVVARVFDPFFTTKPLGQGTGLGLSMVYGFARQSGGQVRVYSEVGQGTTMCLYFPRHHGQAAAEDPHPPTQLIGRGEGETILLVEDEENLRVIISELLAETGYRVATAADGPAGLRALGSLERVDLLITDVGLPGGLNGRQVADAARVQRPDLKVLFVTGYAENAAVGNGLLDPGMEVMSKPFDVAALTARVREMIG